MNEIKTTLPAKIRGAEICFNALRHGVSRRNDPCRAAVAKLREDTQEWWADTLARDPAELEEDEELFTADAEGLRRFLEGEVLPWFEARKKELAAHPRAGVR